ncbi:MAG: choice-of-anchor I family protein [Desulfococcaceae bacterium]
MFKRKWIFSSIGLALLLLGCSSDSNYATVTVERTGAGTGAVSSDPEGIDCGSDCSEPFRKRTEVTLTATPATGSTFAGWGGPCGGTGDCTFAINDDVTVTARFDAGAAEPPPSPTGFLTPLGTFETGIFDESAAEIAAYDPATRRLFVVNGNDAAVDVLDIGSPSEPTRLKQIAVSDLGGGITSIAFYNGILAAAIEAETAQDNGTVAFFDADGNLLGQVEVGPLPDMVTFTPDGETVLAALEGEPNDDYTVDPEGGVAIIDISGGPASATARTAGFAAFNDRADELIAQGLRVFGPGATLAQDVEPEYIAVSPDGTTAFVSLQENNAVASVDIAAAEVTAIFPLGFKDHGLEVNAMDASDRDDAINIRPWPVHGMYQPDAIAAFERNGSLYLVTANEGDARDYDGFSEEVRVKDLTLDPTAFPNAAELQADSALGRLTVTNTMGDMDGDGEYERLYSFGARSFTVWEITSAGPLPVWDSGDDFERITAQMFPENFNDHNDENDPDSRSDAKGPEPEGVVVGMVGGIPHAFIGLERIGGVMVYSLDQPANPQFVTYINNRNFEGDPEAGTAGDLGPEGLVFIPAADSPTGGMMLAVANEVSGTTTLYGVTPEAAEAPMAMLQLLHASDLEGGVEAIENAPNFAAIADFFDDRYPTLTISAGDNFIPGPFFNAAGDDEVEGPLRRVLANPNASAGVGRGDVAMMNLIGFDASAFGNHEFDTGTGVIADNIGTDIDMDEGTAEWLGAQFPYLSANLDFSDDGDISGLFTDALLEGTAFESRLDDLTAAGDAPKIAPAAILAAGGERFGVVGATTPILESISSPGDTRVKNPGAGTDDMDALATHIQPRVDMLRSEGIDKIVLTTHLQQLALERELIGKLRGVDIVIAGGSDTLLADGEDVARGLRSGDTPADTYPIVTTNADGDPALIVSTDGEYRYVGRLVVGFDENGRVVPESVDPNVSGVFAATESGVAALWGDAETAFRPGSKGFGVRTLTEAIRGVVIAKDGEVFGSTEVFLNGAREDVRTQETNLGNLTADANLAAARTVDGSVAVSIKNGGGIRAAIGEIREVSPGVYEQVPPRANPAAGKQEGQISQLDIENSLRFDNQLTIMTLSAADLLEIMEHAVSATEPGATPGQFPQVGGMAFSFDPTLEPGDRIRSLAIVDENGNAADVIAQNGEVSGDPDRPIRIVTLNFLAGGGDGYPFETLGENVVETGIGEQSALADFLAANYAGGAAFMMTDTEPAEDARIQNLAFRADAVIGEAPSAAFALQLLHFADVDGGGTAAMSNVDEFSALVDHFRDQRPENTVLVSSGDNYIPGPIFQASDDPRLSAVIGEAGQGRGETEIQNRMGLQISAVGNHDLDTGPGGFADIISPDGAYPGARFPYVSGNIDFSADDATAPLVVEPGLEAAQIPGKLAPSGAIFVDGEWIGFVGAVTPTLPAITSVGDLGLSPEGFTENAAGLDALAGFIQPEVDRLVDQGIDKIVLLSHMQRIDVERGLATRLEHVDVIVAGGSNTLLADETDVLREGDAAAGEYPEVYASPLDEPVLLVNTDGDYKYLGRLVMEFDDAGRVLPDRLNPAENGAWAAVPAVTEGLDASPIPAVAEVADAIRQILGEQDGEAFGLTNVFLDGRRESVRSRETNLGNLSADANLWYAQRFDDENPPQVSVKNGGGIRAPIGRIVNPPGSTSSEEVELLPPAANDFGKPEGGVSQLDIQTALAFDNGLALVTMTAAELRDLTEEMILGNFAHVGGMRVEFDPSRPARDGGDENMGLSTNGERVRRLEVETSPGVWDLVVEEGVVVGDPDRPFRVVALDFLSSCAAPEDGEFFSANCGSGWPFKNLANPRFVSLLETDLAEFDPGMAAFSKTGGEQDALAEFLREFHPDEARAYDVPIDVNERLIPLEGS